MKGGGARGVLGILFIALGLFGIYEVLTGRFPSSAPLSSSGGGGGSTGPTGPVAGTGLKHPITGGSGPVDHSASQGGFK